MANLPLLHFEHKLDLVVCFNESLVSLIKILVLGPHVVEIEENYPGGAEVPDQGEMVYVR